MTKKERLIEATNAHKEEAMLSFSSIIAEEKAQSFFQGAMWSAEHADWRKFPENMPDQDGEYLIFVDNEENEWFGLETCDFFTDKKIFGFVQIEDNHPTVYSVNNSVKAWMPLPGAPIDSEL